MPVEWNDEQFVKRVEKACERGVNKGAFILQEAIKDRLGRVGMFKLRRSRVCQLRWRDGQRLHLVWTRWLF